MPSLLTLQTPFRSKLWRMGKILSKGGGIQREQKIHGWKEGPESVWSLRGASVEVCLQLMKCKHQVEANVYFAKSS